MTASIPSKGKGVPTRRGYGAGMTDASTSHSGFGGLLRGCRVRQGLSQQELAVRAGTTTRHLSFLETGRSRPRTGMVLRLAAELGLSPREQNAMLEAAGLRTVFPHRALTDSEMSRYDAVIDSLLERHEPLPAAVVDRYGALVRTNEAFERLTPGMVGVEPEDLVDRLFGPGPWRATLVNWPDVAAAWLARHRVEADRTGDPRLRALISRAERLIGPLPEGTGTPELPALCARIRAGEEVIELFTVTVRFDHAHDVTLNELRVELMYAGNDTADRFFGTANTVKAGGQRT